MKANKWPHFERPPSGCLKWFLQNIQEIMAENKLPKYLMAWLFFQYSYGLLLTLKLTLWGKSELKVVHTSIIIIYMYRHFAVVKNTITHALSILMRFEISLRTYRDTKRNKLNLSCFPKSYCSMRRFLVNNFCSYCSNFEQHTIESEPQCSRPKSTKSRRMSKRSLDEISQCLKQKKYCIYHKKVLF